jgi:Rrf2 family protein
MSTVGNPRCRRHPSRQDGGVQISAQVDYALRALLTLAASDGRPVKGESLATAQDLPLGFLENIMGGLRRAGLVVSYRGADGGYRLGRPANEITVGMVIRATGGPLANIRGRRPEEISYQGAARHLQDVWIAARATLRRVLDEVTIADIVSGTLPKAVTELSGDPGAWMARASQP